MRVSVAMCTFNGARFLQEQLDSLAHQVTLPDELVVVDDGSTDATAALVESFAERAPFPVQFHRNERQLGVSANFEKAISLCRGDVVFTCDQDDVWLPTKISRMLPAFADDAAQVVACDADLTDAHLRRVGQTLWGSVRFRARDRVRVQRGEGVDVLVMRNFVAGMAMAMRRSFSVQVFPVPTPWLHDGWAALRAAVVGGLRLVPDRLVLYRLHGRNAVGLPDHGRLKSLAYAWRLPRDKVMLEADLMAAAIPHLQGNVPAGALKRFQDRGQHMRARASLQKSRAMRIPGILAELTSGRYHAFSKGSAAAVLDLLRRVD